jgi:hypothetical protein
MRLLRLALLLSVISALSYAQRGGMRGGGGGFRGGVAGRGFRSGLVGGFRGGFANRGFRNFGFVNRPFFARDRFFFPRNRFFFGVGFGLPLPFYGYPSYPTSYGYPYYGSSHDPSAYGDPTSQASLGGRPAFAQKGEPPMTEAYAGDSKWHDFGDASGALASSASDR